MKKIILLLLIPLLSFSQSKITLDHSYTDPAGFVVGQTITVKFNMIYPVDASINPTYLFIDFEYNNKLLALEGATFYAGSSTWYQNYTGYKFVTDWPNIKELDDKYFNAGVSYDSSQQDWSILRFSIQDASPISQEITLVEFTFTVKDKANTGYTDYTNLTNLNWADIRNDTTGERYDVESMQQNISLEEVKGGDAGSVTLNLNTPSSHATDYLYSIKNETGEEVASGRFDENKQAIISGLENDIEYTSDIFVDIQTATWLDEVVTISDAYTNFLQVASDVIVPGGNMEPHYDYGVQFLLGEVNNSGNIDSQDSYIMLNHILGETVSEWFTNSTNGAFNFSGTVADWGVPTNDYYFGLNKTFKPTDANKVFEFMHALGGDVDFSHSFVPTKEGSKFEKSQTVASAEMRALSIAANAENYDLDITSSLVDGKVELSINLTKADLVGIQFILDYDKDILTFDEVVFDTGNEMTNFANERNDKLFIGSIDTDGSSKIKTGIPYKLVFTPKVDITNTAGLIYFNVADAVKENGTKVNLNIE